MPPEVKKHPGIRIDFICVKRSLFEHQENAFDLPPETRVDGTIEIGAHQAFRSDGKGARLTLIANLRSLYIIDVAVIAQFSPIEGSENLSVTEFAQSGAAISAVFPFLRQHVGEITTKGRFGPLWIDVINPQLLVRPKTEGELAALPPEMSSGPRE